MARRTTGVLLLFVAAMLYSTRYLAAAIFGSGISSWSTQLFNGMLQNVGPGLLIWSRLALIAGLIYLIWAEAEAVWVHYRLPDDGPRRSSK
jgi:hypothetical protein